MGQPVSVVEKPSSVPGVVRFECNRSLTGTGHERYGSLADVTAERPCDVLARRLFEHGGVDRLHIHSNMVTVDLAKGSSGAGLLQVVIDLFQHYTEGVQPSIP